MAREEADREDLLREATAYVERALLSVIGLMEPVFVGFRRDGCASVYFGADPVYHFNTHGELRRAFCRGRLIKAERGRLASLERERPGHEVQFVRHDLDAGEEAALLKRVTEALDALRSALAEGHFRLEGQQPPDVDVVARIRGWLASMDRIGVAQSPRVR